MTEPDAWLGRQDHAADVCALPLVRRLAALLDRDPRAFQDGQDLPRGWHMILFTPETPQSGLGPDGHPAAAAKLAPATLPRRMLGGRRTRFPGRLQVGAAVRRVSEVVAFEEKQGRSGRLAVATMRHSIFQAGEDAAAVIEEQDVIYREAAGRGGELKPVSAAPEPGRPTPVRSRGFSPDPVLLFRYSAATFNAHRIHYDAEYATSQEGYPGLIVNGGLTALLLLELFKEAAGCEPAVMTVRNRLPLLCGRPARLCAAPGLGGAAEGWSLWAEDEHGSLALEASAA